ncbi:unnamed protein product [Caretta caretta]
MSQSPKLYLQAVGGYVPIAFLRNWIVTFMGPTKIQLARTNYLSMSMESLHEESDKNASFFVLRGTESFSSSFDNLDSDVKVSKLQLESVKVETTNAEGVGRKLNYQLRLFFSTYYSSAPLGCSKIQRNWHHLNKVINGAMVSLRSSTAMKFILLVDPRSEAASECKGTLCQGTE